VVRVTVIGVTMAMIIATRAGFRLKRPQLILSRFENESDDAGPDDKQGGK
jgi:hypothetical protein